VRADPQCRLDNYGFVTAYCRHRALQKDAPIRRAIQLASMINSRPSLPVFNVGLKFELSEAVSRFSSGARSKASSR
jgi:hypothetical protein